MSSEVIGPVLILGIVTTAGVVSLGWAASSLQIGPPASALVGVDDHVHDVDGDGVVDGHRVVVEAVASSLEGAKLELVIGQGGLRGDARGVEGSAVYVPCSVWSGHVQVVAWTSRVQGVYHREVVRELDLSGCPGSSVVDRSEPSPEVDGSGGSGGYEVDPCPWAPYSLDVEWGLYCLESELGV